MTKKTYFFYLSSFLVILFLPLLNLPPWFSPPAWGKTIVFRSLLAIVFFIFLIKNKINWSEIKKSKVFLPFLFLLIFFTFAFLSLLASPDITLSLWGDPSRAGGFVNYSFYLLLAILTFLIIKEKDWKLILNFSLIIAFLTGLIAICQKFSLLEQFFIFGQRPSATMGNPGILSHFLVPIFFIALTFFIKEKQNIKKYLYLFLSFYFAYLIIFITETRAAFLGLLIGFIYFLFFLPQKDKKIKIAIIAILLLIGSSFFFLRNPDNYQNWPDSLKRPITRIMTLTQGLEAEQSRLSTWRISFEAFKEKPYFGYGPENFNTAFNKHFDPTLPRMENIRWFDRAHNSLLDTLIQHGLLALIFYLLFFFSTLYYLLKKKEIISHGISAALLAFFITSLFSIDSFSTYLIFFLLIGYSFSLIGNKNYLFLKKKCFLIYFLLIPLIWFLLEYNLVVFQQNTKINLATEVAATDILEQERDKKTFLTHYLNTKYVTILKQDPEKAIELLSENTEIRPDRTRNWLYLGKHFLEINEPEQAQEAFNQAWLLRPKDNLIILESVLSDLSVDNLELAQEKIDFCFANLSDFKECYWLSGLLNIRLNNIKQGEEEINKAQELNYPIDNEPSLNRLISAYSINNHYSEIAQAYEKLIEINPKAQYKSSLAFVYKQMGQYDKARNLAQEILTEYPEQAPAIDAFLETF